LPDRTFQIQLTDHGLVVEFVPGKDELPDLPSCAEELERRIKNFMRLDRLLHTIQQQREAEKLAIAGLVGKRARYVRYLKRHRKIGIFLKRFEYLLDPLRVRLAGDNEDVFDRVVDRGLVCRIVLPADEETKDDVAETVLEFVKRFDGQADIYDRMGLETFVRESLLTSLAKERQIPLSGTRGRIISMVVYDDVSKVTRPKP